MIMGKTLFEIFRESPIMIILLATSITALGLIIERLIYFARNRFNPGRGFIEIRTRLRNSGPDEALNWAQNQNNPLGRVFTLALENLTLPADERSDLLYSAILEERVKFERLLGGMGTLANAATLLGLLGTVAGLILAFGNIAETGSGGPAVVSGGIAQALLTTAFGLIIGIPTLFFYNYFAKKSSDTTMILESTAERLTVMLERYKRAVSTREASPTVSSRSAASGRRTSTGTTADPTPAQPQPANDWEF